MKKTIILSNICLAVVCLFTSCANRWNPIATLSDITQKESTSTDGEDTVLTKEETTSPPSAKEASFLIMGNADGGSGGVTIPVEITFLGERVISDEAPETMDVDVFGQVVTANYGESMISPFFHGDVDIYYYQNEEIKGMVYVDTQTKEIYSCSRSYIINRVDKGKNLSFEECTEIAWHFLEEKLDINDYELSESQTKTSLGSGGGPRKYRIAFTRVIGDYSLGGNSVELVVDTDGEVLSYNYYQAVEWNGVDAETISSLVDGVDDTEKLKEKVVDIYSEYYDKDSITTDIYKTEIVHLRDGSFGIQYTMGVNIKSRIIPGSGGYCDYLGLFRPL